MQRKMNKNKTNYKRIMIQIVFLIVLLSLAGYFGWEMNQKINDEIIYERDLEIGSLERSIDLLKDIKEQEIEQIKKQNLEQVTKLNNQLQRSGFLDFMPEVKTIKDFLRKDKTNEEEYDEFHFNCVDYTQRLVNNLFSEGIYSCYTYIEFENGGHAIVAINTTDKGVIYVEPQDDSIIYSMEVGDDYCDLANWDCNLEIKKKVSCFD